MKVRRNTLVSQEQDVRLSAAYNGYLALKALSKNDRLSIFDLYDYLQRNSRNFNYATTLNTLILLYVTGIIDFDPPYIYKLTQTAS